jgi:formate C-acetyltransferase
MSKVDFSDYPAIAVIDAQLPLASNYEVTVNAFSSMLKAFVMQGGPMLQCSVVNPEILKAAQDHPEQHSGLVVRVCGFSAYFVALGKGVQDEIIDRTLLRMN